MQGLYIRNLNINYTDPTQKVVYDEELPKKFTEIDKLLTDDSQYKKKPAVQFKPQIVIPKPSPPVVVAQKNCFSGWCSWFNVNLCPQCKGRLCQQCRNSKFLKFSMCDSCRKQLCPQCRRVFEGKRVKLRHYTIKLKNIKQLHFKDCECQDCKKNKQKN